MIFLVSIQKELFCDGMSVLVLNALLDFRLVFTLYLLFSVYDMTLDLGCCNKLIKSFF